MNQVMALFALVVFAAYVFVLIWKVPEPDLIIVTLIAVGLVTFDFFGDKIKAMLGKGKDQSGQDS
ncbi:MAG: hypothetical protein ACPGOY_03255 [Rhodospirillaceae bacterium]